MNKKLELLEEGLGESFIMIDEQNYKSNKGDALVLSADELVQLGKDRINEEIPYIENNILKKFLPEKFNNDFILNEYKELSKFDHTILSNSISDKLGLYYEVTKTTPISDIIFCDSELTEIDNHYIFYLKTEY